MKRKNIENTKEVSGDFVQESVMCDETSLLKNWKGLATGKKDKIKRLTSSKNTSLDLLSNGSNSPSGVAGVILEYTCALDSIVKSLAVAYVNRMCIRKLIDTKTVPMPIISLANKDYIKKYTG